VFSSIWLLVLKNNRVLEGEYTDNDSPGRQTWDRQAGIGPYTGNQLFLPRAKTFDRRSRKRRTTNVRYCLPRSDCLILAKTTSSSATAQKSTPLLLPVLVAVVPPPPAVLPPLPPNRRSSFSADVTRRKNRPCRVAIKFRISLAIVSFLSRRLVEMYSSLRPAMIFWRGKSGHVGGVVRIF
jgi:hypothetical protein